MAATGTSTSIGIESSDLAKQPVLSQVIMQEPITQEEAEFPRRYGIPTYFQVSPTQVALLLNRRVTNAAVVDLEDGWDICVFDSFEQIRASNIKPSLRNYIEPHPEAGTPVEMVHHLPIGGFVPLGAKLPDGRDHPHAGTGFGLSSLSGHPAGRDEAVPTTSNKPRHSAGLLVQYAFDGRELRITSQERIDRENYFPGYYMMGRGLSPALPDGEDLIFALVGGELDEHVAEFFRRCEETGRKPLRGGAGKLGECYGAYFSRWRRIDGVWRIVEMQRIFEPGPDQCGEPTMVRDGDGSLLVSVRSKGAEVPPGERDAVGKENLYQAFRVYRSTDNGKSWQRVLCLPEMRGATPVTINQMGDGEVYIAANPTLPVQKDSKGRTIAMVHQRQRLWIWPLTADRTDVERPRCVMDAVETFGPPRPLESHACDNLWKLDHPLGLVCRLGDGQWHNLFAFRVSDGATNSGGASAAPQSGLYMYELPGEVQAKFQPWRFG